MTFNSKFKNGSIVALGNFDGMHLGHKSVINFAIDLANELNAVPCVMMFSEHSLKAIKGKAPAGLYSGEVKEDVLQNIGVNVCYIDFKEIRNMTAEQFVKLILVDKFNAKGVCCGFNYHFGKNASGNVKVLKELCEKYHLTLSVAPPTNYFAQPISSTRIRQALRSGNIQEANEMLGRIFSYKSKVVTGAKRGTNILNHPTINQEYDKSLTVPKYGVYASQTIVDNKCYASVTNIGIRPTIGTNNLISETHILGFSGDLYGREIEVGLVKYLRGEIKFESLEKLKEQIGLDAKRAKAIFAKDKDLYSIMHK